MPDVKVRTTPLTRNKLTAFFKDFELVKFFENLSFDVSGALPQAAAAGQDAANAAQQTADDALARADAGHLGVFGQQGAQQALASAQDAQRTGQDALDRAAALQLGVFGEQSALQALSTAQGAQRTADLAQAAAGSAGSNADAALLGIFGRQVLQPGTSIQPGDLIVVTNTAAGQRIAVDVAQLMLAIRMLAPKAPPPALPNDLQAVLAARMFSPATPRRDAEVQPVNLGGTGAANAATARANLGAAAAGVNGDITRITALAQGIVRSTATVSTTALNTPVELPNSDTFSGLLTIRDQTLGGGALYLVDPNGGVTLVASSITGIAVTNAGAGAGFRWQIATTSSTAARTFNWALLGGL